MHVCTRPIEKFPSNRGILHSWTRRTRFHSLRRWERSDGRERVNGGPLRHRPSRPSQVYPIKGLDTTFNAVAGVLIATVGTVALYTLDVVMFLVAFTFYATVTIPTRLQTPESEDAPGPDAVAADGGEEPAAVECTDDTELDGSGTSYRDDLLEGVAMFRGSVLWKLSAAVFLGICSYWLMFAALAAFAAERGGPALYGLLLGGLAAGGLLGFLLAPTLRSRPFGRVVVTLSGLCGAARFLALRVPWVSATVVLVAVSTVVIGVFTVNTQTLFQTAVPEHLLGRAVALQMTVAGVAAPAGALLGGVVVAALGVEATVTLLGLGHVAVGAAFLLDGELRSFPAVSAVDPAEIGLGRE